jgi:hypothetical protein
VADGLSDQLEQLEMEIGGMTGPPNVEPDEWLDDPPAKFADLKARASDTLKEENCRLA